MKFSFFLLLKKLGILQGQVIVMVYITHEVKNLVPNVSILKEAVTCPCVLLATQRYVCSEAPSSSRTIRDCPRPSKSENGDF